MTLILNDGKVLELPQIVEGDVEAMTTGTLYNYNKQPCHYYARFSPPAVFDQVRDFCDEVDALGVSYARPNSIRELCTSLAAVNWHTADYFAPNAEGGQLIENINLHTYWIMGNSEKGGLGMCKVGNEYAFVAFSGVYKGNLDNNDTVYTYYGYQCSCYEYEGWKGTFTRTELQHSCLANFRNLEADEPPIYIFYQPDGWEYLYVEDYSLDISTGMQTSQWTSGSIETAMDNAAWFGVSLDIKYLPEQPFHCAYNGNESLTEGYYEIAKDLGREGYEKTSGSIYGDAEAEEDDPFANGGYNFNGGGGGGWDKGSNQGGWTEDDQFTVDALNSGFFTLYSPTKEEIQSFNDFLFTDITDSMAAQLKKMITDPLNYVVFLAMCHLNPELSNNKHAIKYCGLDSGIPAYIVQHQMLEINCGSIELLEDRETSSFLSYNPYYKIHLYLPYISTVELNADEVMGCTINIRYWVDLLSGSCIAQVISKRSVTRCSSDIPNPEGIVIGEYSGNCYLHLPLTATDWRGLYSSIIQFAGGLVSAASGNLGGVGTMASAVMNEKVNVSKSGQLGANYGYLGFQKPYLLLERSNVAIAGYKLGSDNKSSFGGFQGWKCNIIKPLGQFHGYTEISQNCLWVDKIDGITEEEAQMLRDDFANGVYLNWE